MMISKKSVGLFTGVVGLVLVVAGSVLYSTDRVTDYDSRVAFKSLVRIPLADIEKAGSFRTVIAIPNDSQWCTSSVTDDRVTWTDHCRSSYLRNLPGAHLRANQTIGKVVIAAGRPISCTPSQESDGSED